MYNGDLFSRQLPSVKLPVDLNFGVNFKTENVTVRVHNALGVTEGFTYGEFHNRLHQFMIEDEMTRAEAEKALDNEVFKRLRKQLMTAVDSYIVEQTNRYNKDIQYTLVFKQDKRQEPIDFMKYSMRVDIRVVNVNGRLVSEDSSIFNYGITERC